MFDKLNVVEVQYDEVMSRLGTTEIQSNSSEYRKTLKTLAEIEPIVQKYRALKTVQKEI